MRGSIGVAVFVLLAGCSSPGSPPKQQEVVAPAGSPEQPKQETPKQEAAADEALCQVAGAESWKACDGKRVRVEGRAPQMVMQHPMMDGPTPGGGRTHQEYLEVEGGSQIVVTSRKPSDCRGAMAVTGTLRSIDLGGEPGTKDSYKGWSIVDATIECK